MSGASAAVHNNRGRGPSSYCSCHGAFAKWKGICLQSRQPRFDSEPRLHGGQHWCAGGPYKPAIAPDQGARQSSILWTTTKFTPPSFNGSGHHATNVETGVQILSGVPGLRARAANRMGHQPPKLAICEFESHRAFHAGLI